MSDYNLIPIKKTNTPADVSDSFQKRSEQNRLRDACLDFEAIFLQQLFKAMRATVPDSGFLGGNKGPTMEFFQSMQDEFLAREIASKNSMGLAPLMMKQLGVYPEENNFQKTLKFMDKNTDK